MEGEVAGRMELLGMIHSFVTPFVLKAAVQLEIPDVIARAGRPLSATEILAGIQGDKKTRPQPDILQRMLNFMVTRNVLSRFEGDDGCPVYGINGVSKWLVREGNNGEALAPLLLMEMNNRCLASWQRLDEVILHGGDAFARANDGYGFWECGRTDQEFNNVANNAMIAFSKATMSAVVANYHGFADIRGRLVDVGGGMGHSIAKIVQAYPHIDGVNFDLPHVVKTAPHVQGVTHIAGNMFESIPAADAIFLKSVLHNWDDERCRKLLTNCNRALRKDGKLIILDIIYRPSDKLAQIEANLDMIMIAYTTGGMERTPSQWCQLLSSCGFSRVTLLNMPTKEGVIEAYKD